MSTVGIRGSNSNAKTALPRPPGPAGRRQRWPFQPKPKGIGLPIPFVIFASADYSYRRAVAGRTREAFCAGNQQAIKVTPSVNATTAAISASSILNGTELMK